MTPETQAALVIVEAACRDLDEFNEATETMRAYRIIAQALADLEAKIVDREQQLVVAHVWVKEAEARCAALENEVAVLRPPAENYHRMRVATEAATIERCAQALRKYHAEHVEGECRKWLSCGGVHYRWLNDEPCTCGLDDLLALRPEGAK